MKTHVDYIFSKLATVGFILLKAKKSIKTFEFKIPATRF